MVKKYLLDTNICAFYIRGQFNLNTKIREAGGLEFCAISEITLAELRYGAELSKYKEENAKKINTLIEFVSVLPINRAIPLFAKEKARLKSINKIIDNFDLLIGTTAVVNNLVMVSDNVKHLSRIENIKLENWVQR